MQDSSLLDHSSQKIKGSIAHKVLLYIILFSSFVTLLITFYQLYSDYQEQTVMVDQNMRQIELSYRDSLGNAIWFLDDTQIENILAGIMEFEDVNYVNVQVNEGESFSLGEQRAEENLRRYEVDVTYNIDNSASLVGRLNIESNLDGVISRLKDKFWLILISQGLKTFLVSLFILFIIFRLVTRHLKTISDFASALDIKQKNVFLDLNRNKNKQENELDQIAISMNQMKQNLIDDANEKEIAELNLRKLSQAVEQSSSSILILDAQGKIEYVNPKFESSTGYSLNKINGTQSNILCFGRKKESDYKEIWNTIASGKEWRGEAHTECKDGELFWESISVSSINNEKKIITHYLIVKEDISELRKLKKQLELERDYLREEVNTIGNFGEIVGASKALETTMSQVEAVAQTSASVLILGESGVGKEMIARAIHTRSNRAEHPMVKVNCASIPNELFESEFFGHIKGSFTGAHQERIGRLQLADGGTLFLDEVGEIPVSQQGKLLRALQEGEFERIGDNKTIHVNVRVVAATNRDMAEEIKAGRFREDLFYRLNVFPIHVPPLRDRLEDIVPLALGFLEDACAELNRGPFLLSQAQLKMLQAYSWPGNIRELKNTIERAVISSSGSKLRIELQAMDIANVDSSITSQPLLSTKGYLTQKDFKNLEKENIIAALKHAKWKTWGDDGAAVLLGIKPSTLAYQMKVFGIKKPVNENE